MLALVQVKGYQIKWCNTLGSKFLIQSYPVLFIWVQYVWRTTIYVSTMYTYMCYFPAFFPIWQKGGCCYHNQLVIYNCKWFEKLAHLRAVCPKTPSQDAGWVQVKGYQIQWCDTLGSKFFIQSYPVLLRVHYVWRTTIHVENVYIHVLLPSFFSLFGKKVVVDTTTNW